MLKSLNKMGFSTNGKTYGSSKSEIFGILSKTKRAKNNLMNLLLKINFITMRTETTSAITKSATISRSSLVTMVKIQ